ncbi:glycosyltransferase [Collinsella sp. LCP21S3_E4]|uniref:glycosyltransferase n=1 Tax=Collinsella sp. LCP21S3_E4 TaxID=3438774 RepID=UPI003F8F4322
MNLNNIVVIIPCHNEALTIAKVVDDFHRELPEATVYVYDNNSSDGTAQIAREHGATVKFEPIRTRATSAVKCSVISKRIATLWSMETTPTRRSRRALYANPSLPAKRI